MKKQEIMEALKGESYNGMAIPVPVDSISLDALANLLERLFESIDGEVKHDGVLKEGVTVNARGIHMKDGKFIKKSEAYL